MKLETIEVAVVGTYKTYMYGVRIKNVNDNMLQEMKEHAKLIGAGPFANSTGSVTIWFEKESTRTLFLLRWQ